MSLGLLFFYVIRSYGRTERRRDREHDAIIQPQNATHDVQKVSYRDA
jgi:hypothetical protein